MIWLGIWSILVLLSGIYLKISSLGAWIFYIIWSSSAIILLWEPTIRLIQDLRRVNERRNPPIIRPSFFYRLFLLRVPIITGLILFFFPIVSTGKLSQSLENIFVMESGQQLIMAIFMPLFTAIALGSMIKTILLLRYLEDNNKKRWILFLNLILITVLAAPSWIVLSRLNNIHTIFEHKTFLGIAIVLSIGLLLSSIFFEVSVVPQEQERYNEIKFLRIILNILEIILGVIIYLIVIFLNDPLSNHELSLPIFGISIKLDVIRKLINNNLFSSPGWHPPTLIYALSIILIMTILIGGLTYYWDLFFDEWKDAEAAKQGFQRLSIFQRITNEFQSFRFPVLLCLIIFSASSYGAFQVDHYFKLNQSQTQITNYQETLRTAIGRRLCPEEFDSNKRCISPQSLVIVAASGGGIQASGWTAQVLGGLQEKIGKDFTKKTALISSVSGGSVGTMFYLDNLDNRILRNPSEMIKNATEDWLGSVGWGLAYPDLLRFIGFWGPWTQLHKNDRFVDRGYALEKSWESDLEDKNQTLDDWYNQIVQGDIPIPIFNATLVENGRRFLISPMKLINRNMPDYLKAVNQPGKNGNGDNLKESKALDLKTLFNCGTPEDPKQCNLNITTAARLSASFPYVSPMPRNYIDYGENKEPDQDSFENIFKDIQKDPNNKINCLNKPENKADKKVYNEVCIKQNYHIADGGYFDNGGTFTAIERLDKFLKLTEQPKDDKSTAKPENDQKNEVTKDQDKKSNKPYSLNIKKIVLLNINAFPEAPLNAQQEGSLGYVTSGLGAVNTLNSVRDATQIARNIKEADLLKTTWDDKGITIETFTISFPYYNMNGEPYNPPLSWRLTDKQKHNLQEAWETDPSIIQTVTEMKTFWNKPMNSSHQDSKSENRSSTIKTVAN